MRKTCGEIPVIKCVIALFFIGFCFCALSSSHFLSKCHWLFRSDDSVKYNLSENASWTNSYAQEVFSFVYQQIPLLEGQVLSHTEVKNYMSYFEKLIDQLESSSDSSVRSRLELMNSHLSGAVKAFPMIVSFINGGRASEYESLDANTVVKLVLSTFSQHTMAYLTHPKVERLDWPRMNLILKSISDFKDKTDVFSLYKIKRAVLQKYSLNEYVNCK